MNRLPLTRRTALGWLAAAGSAPALAAPGGLPNAQHDDSSPEWQRISGKLFAGRNRLAALVLGQAVEQRSADRAMLDVGALVHAEKAQRFLRLDAVTVDQAFDLRARDPRELALVGIERAEARRI